MNLIVIVVVFLSVILRVQGAYTGQVCGHDQHTYSSVSAAHAKGTTVMHCGTCGKCSNKHDINIYKETRNTLTKTTTKCALKSLVPFAGRKLSTKCMRKQVGFTDACNECWIDNIMCDKELCLKTCALWKLFKVGKFVGLLDPCLACDEEKCGPAFGKCAGANRRRSGITSDIPRPGEEVCTVVEPWPSQ